ncbi:MAG: DUF1836 domain-containing protein [Clostridia bacterium]|nr:DUF1836 domain-containing protein [Clostridia bacterium]
MTDMLPGTKIEMLIPEDVKKNGNVPEWISSETEKILNNLFSAGGLVLSQVVQLTGLEYHTVQNWVKRKFLSPPVQKKYSRRQLCRIILINALKDVMTISDIVKMFSYINGHLDDESDDSIADDRLYIYFVGMIHSVKEYDESMIEDAAGKIVSDYTEPFPGSKKRLISVLKIMTYAYYSTVMKSKASVLMTSI